MCLVNLFGRYAIVADKRVCESENLMAVRRVRQTLHIPHHTRLEYWEKLREGRERRKEQKKGGNKWRKRRSMYV